MSTYIWSDLHLGHKNIIEYEKRPFNNVDEMNKHLLKSWRNIVKKKDTIINLGDFCFGMNKEMVSDILNKMPGYKVLVLGNHDRGRSVKWWLETGFNEVYRYPIIYEDFYILSHESIYVCDSMPYINVHGHTHSESTTNPRKVNVSVERTNYFPILFDNIKKKFIKE